MGYRRETQAAGRRAKPAEAGAVTQRTRTKPSEARRDDLMGAAAALFIEKGIGATTVDDIVAAAGVAKGTFYLYFASKEELLAALRERFVNGFLERVEARVGACAADDWPARLAAWLEGMIDYYLDHVELHDVVFHDHRPDQRRMKGENAAVVALAGLLDAGAAAGAWQADDAAQTAVFLFHGLHGVVDDAIARGATRRAELVARVTEFAFRSLAAR